MKSLKEDLIILTLLFGLLGVTGSAHATIINGYDWELNLEYRFFTPANPPFSRRVYVCETSIVGNCEDAARWNALRPETGWERAAARVRLFDSSFVSLPTPPGGVPSVIDFGGYTLNYTADVLGGSLLDFSGPFATASVARDTTLIYDVGTVVHEATDELGNVYALFIAETSVAEAYDLTQVGALGNLALPSGWIYSSRTLAESLHVASNGNAAVMVGPTTTWQLFKVVSAPATIWLVIGALLGLCAVQSMRDQGVWRSRRSRGQTR